MANQTCHRLRVASVTYNQSQLIQTSSLTLVASNGQPQERAHMRRTSIATLNLPPLSPRDEEPTSGLCYHRARCLPPISSRRHPRQEVDTRLCTMKGKTILWQPRPRFSQSDLRADSNCLGSFCTDKSDKSDAAQRSWRLQNTRKWLLCGGHLS